MKIKHVYGNVLKLDIPLTIKIRTMEGDVPTEREEPFYPDVSKGCAVILGSSYNRKIQYDATVNGNVAHIEDDGVIGIGTYKVTVKCYDEEGNPYRYMVRDIIEICDATIDAGIEAGVEFNAETYTLDGAVFVSYGVEQVQSDWAETDPEEKSFIKNKPTNLVEDESYVHTDNNYTDEEKEKLAELENYNDSEIRQELNGKVDKVAGKGLSTNDYTDEEKEKLAGLENYDDTLVRQLINEEKTARQQSDNALSESVTQEETRAKGVEQNLDSKIGVNTVAIATEKTRAENAEQTLQLAIDTINGKIPSQATSQNQLADKEFVNSSISTATADFKGTYNSIEDLEQVTANANDYAFVIANDAAGNTLYKRYKWVEGTGWTWEYDLNNSSFTQAQWAAIQSGITAALVTKLSDLPDNSTLNQRITQAIATALLSYYTKSEIDTALAGKEDSANKVTSWQSTPDDTHYPSEKLVKDSIDGMDKVFVAKFGTTTSTEILNAVQNGKIVVAREANNYAFYGTAYGTTLYFINTVSNDRIEFWISSLNDGNPVWKTHTLTFEKSSNKKTTITGNESSDAYYPTTKAVADYAEKKTDIVAPVNTTDATLPITTLSCEVGKYYRIDVAVDTLAVTLPAVTDTTHISNIVFMLTAGTTPAVTFTAPSGINVYYQDGFEIEAGNTYEINALFNGAAWIVAAVKINVE